MENSNRNPRSLREFKAAINSLSPDAQLVFYREFRVLNSKVWRCGLFLLSHLRRADEKGFNPLLLRYYFQDDLPDPLGMAGRLGLTASEIVKQFGHLWVDADDLMAWLVNENRLRLV